MFHIKTSLSAVKEAHWYEYVIRFVFGGVVTAAVGVVGKHYGPIVGGLFLAFPSIMPAAVTFLAKHEKQRYLREGKEKAISAGQNAAAGECIGTALGSVGLLVFGLVLWAAAANLPAPVVLVVACIAWFAAAGLWAVYHITAE